MILDIGTRNWDETPATACCARSPSGTMRILRSYDLLGRTGKDEFLLALPGCCTINAAMMAERLRIEVFGEPFMVPSLAKHEPGEAMPVKLTACCAVASSRGRSPVVVLREAEQTMALAKRSGPGTIRCANDSSLSSGTRAEFASLHPETGALAEAGGWPDESNFIGSRPR